MLISVVRNGGKKTVGDLLSTISTQPVVACVILLKLKGKIKDLQFAVCTIELLTSTWYWIQLYGWTYQILVA